MKVNLDNVISMLELVNIADALAYFNKKTKRFSHISKYSDMTDDEKAKMLENCIELPTKKDIDEEHGMVEDFIKGIKDVELYNQLQATLNEQEAFRRFKTTCINLGIFGDWYGFREKKYKEIAIEWCNKNNIKFA